MQMSSQTILESYPSCFRPNTQQSLLNQTKTNLTSYNDVDPKLDPLPVIDLKQFDLIELEQACTDRGIFRLVNHGIPLILLSKLHEHVVKVYELEFEYKKSLFASIPNDVISYFWGTPALTPTGVALYKDQRTVVDYNWVEGLNFPLSQPSHVDLDQHPLVRDMRMLLQEYGVHQERLAKLIFGAMSQNLQLSNDSRMYLAPSTGFLRVHRYPRCFFDESTKVWGVNAHTDSSVITILNQYEVGGLQILDEKDNVWIDAKPISNTLIVHLGDMMQAISDDKYKSVKHRVKVNSEKERISLGYFVFPDNECVIRSSSYKPFTYPDFRAQVQQDVKTLGHKVGLSRFKLNEDL
ncbi:gibberellin 2-beta-dioxygenase 8-like [Rutidosis leptorrhynchoides]|uniref:gibberellin 2-beta-dioxygenase 8-like n=1 Tax=Rutidosis leptorrhynchoides TaxID=125765 RepID=UPI003A9A3B8A